MKNTHLFCQRWWPAILYSMDPSCARWAASQFLIRFNRNNWQIWWLWCSLQIHWNHWGMISYTLVLQSSTNRSKKTKATNFPWIIVKTSLYRLTFATNFIACDFGILKKFWTSWWACGIKRYQLFGRDIPKKTSVFFTQ